MPETPGKRKVGRDLLAINVLGDEWVAELAKHPPPQYPENAADAFRQFGLSLWTRTVDAPIQDSYGGQRADDWQREIYRKMLPRFEVFQLWFERQERAGGLRARVEAQRLQEQEKGSKEKRVESVRAARHDPPDVDEELVYEAQRRIGGIG